MRELTPYHIHGIQSWRRRQTVALCSASTPEPAGASAAETRKGSAPMEELPPEVVVHILSFLPTADKHSVRCCCRSLLLLADHPALWRGTTVFLTDLRRYTYGFWDTLSRRRITRVAVRHLRRKEWRRLITFLPSLTAIVFVDGGRLYREKYLVNLSRFSRTDEPRSPERHVGRANAELQSGRPAAREKAREGGEGERERERGEREGERDKDREREREREHTA
ncbi:hypothetical protein WMY93_016551 [Mugilogobius chulae]|uniref:F-box domain-containing protein n=1 Tax=Mugilogobius chulae TaxID=88201 RepID=A0AAW0NQ06_9GOBI